MEKSQKEMAARKERSNKQKALNQQCYEALAPTLKGLQGVKPISLQATPDVITRLLPSIPRCMHATQAAHM